MHLLSFMKRSIRFIALSRQCHYTFAVFHEEVNKAHCFVKAVLPYICCLS